MFRKIFLPLFIFSLLFFANSASAHLPRIIYNQSGDIKVQDVEISQAFYDQLGGNPRNYLISSDKEFNLYLNLLVPQASNSSGRYSAKVFSIKNGLDEEVTFIDGQMGFVWKSFYEEFGRDYYLKGPEYEKVLPAGDYKITVFNYENRGKYVLAIGKTEKFTIGETLAVYWKIPILKMEFFQTPIWEFFLTPFGLALLGLIGVILFVVVFINFILFIRDLIRKNKFQMLLLTSSGMSGTSEEILSVMPKPADKIRMAHIITASTVESDTSYVENEIELLKQAGFSVEDVDIAEKNEKQLEELLGDKDVIYVQGGNTFFLLDQMRKSGFTKIIKKLLKKGIVYIGVSAGSIVAGKTIETAGWGDADKNIPGITDLRGLGLVKFNISVHFNEQRKEIISQKSKKEKKNLRIITDEQALFVYGKRVTLVGEGDAVIANQL